MIKTRLWNNQLIKKNKLFVIFTYYAPVWINIAFYEEKSSHLIG